MVKDKSHLGWTSDKAHVEFYYKELRDHIKHEDNLCNNRMTWLITLQAFLFSAYGFSLSAQAVIKNDNAELSSIISSARLCFAAFGVVSSWAILLALTAAALSISRLVARWYEVPAIVRMKYPQIIGNSTKQRPGGTRLGQLPLFLIPVASIVMWAVISFHPTFQWVLTWVVLATLGGGVLISMGMKIGRQIAETEKLEQQEATSSEDASG